MLGHPDGLVQIAGAIRRNALRFRDRTAFVAGAERWTWHEADAASDRLAYRFQEAGIGRSDRVAIFGNNSPCFVFATYALFKLGATAAILNASLRAASLASQLDHAAVKAVVTGDALQDIVETVRGRIGASLFFTWDEQDRSPGVVTLAETLRDRRARAPFPIAEVEPTDIACMIFSSGTTGTPKGAINTYWNLLAKNLSLTLSQELRQSDVGLLATPLCMGGTQLMSINPYILLGISAVIMPGFDAGEALRLIEAERVSTFFCVPTMSNAIVRHPSFETRDLGSLAGIVSAGAPLPQDTYRRLAERGIGVLECYGTSETGGGIMISAGEKARNPGSVGRPMVGFEVAIVDAADRPVTEGEVGEIVMRGDPIAAGYWRQPEIEAEAFANGWFHTGDLGRCDGDGYLYLVDRKKDMIKSGGMNVYPKEIEEILYALPGMAECAVVGLPHHHWGEAVTAFLVVRSDFDLDEAGVRAKLKDVLANYQMPKAVIFVEQLPKTMFGKLSKNKLREDYADFYRT